MLGGWVNPHREQQTIPQGQTSIPPKSCSNGQRPNRAMIRQRSRRRQRRGEPHTKHGLGVLHTAASMKNGKVCRRTLDIGPCASRVPCRRVKGLSITIVYGVWHARGGSRGAIHCAILFVGKIQGGEIKVFRANNRIDYGMIPELKTNLL